MVFYGLDEINNKILDLLRKNARMSYSELGDSVGLSRVAVKNRIDRLEEDGVIKGYHAEVSASSVPGALPFYAYIETNPEMYDSVTEKLKNEPLVSELFHISGNNALLLIGVASSKEERERFAWRVRNSYKGVNYFSTKDIWTVVKGNILPE